MKLPTKKSSVSHNANGETSEHTFDFTFMLNTDVGTLLNNKWVYKVAVCLYVAWTSSSSYCSVLNLICLTNLMLFTPQTENTTATTEPYDWISAPDIQWEIWETNLRRAAFHPEGISKPLWTRLLPPDLPLHSLQSDPAWLLLAVLEAVTVRKERGEADGRKGEISGSRGKELTGWY